MDVQNRHARLTNFLVKFTAVATVATTLLAVSSLSGCGKNAEPSKTSSMRAVNVAPESGSLNIVVDDATTNLQTGIASKPRPDFQRSPTAQGAYVFPTAAA